MKAMILAAGYGTRFRPATYEIPKPLIPLCNLPLIGYAMEALLAAGVREFVVNLHHIPERLRLWLERTYSDRCTIAFSYEPSILGTGGGIRKVRDLLATDDDFFLMNGDTVQAPPLGELRDARQKSDALAALVLRRPPENDRFTKVFYEDGSVTGIGQGRGEALMFAGCHVISRRIFEVLPDQEYSGITEDVYIPTLTSGSDALAAVIDDGFWFDIGTPKRYLEASDALRQLMMLGEVKIPLGSAMQGDSIVHETAVTPAGASHSSIGPECTAHPSTTIAGSAVWSGAHISADCRIARSIIAEEVVIPRGTTVENALVCRRLDDVDYPAGAVITQDFVAAPVDPDRPCRFDLR